MDLTAYESLSWEKQFEYLKQMKGFSGINPTSKKRRDEWIAETKTEALNAWKEEVKRMRAEAFQKNILKPREEKKEAVIQEMAPPLLPPQAGIISEPISSGVLSPVPVVKKEKSLQQLQSEVDSVVREVLSRYG